MSDAKKGRPRRQPPRAKERPAARTPSGAKSRAGATSPRLPGGSGLGWEHGPLAGALLLLALTPFFRGLYFPLEQMVALLVAIPLAAWALALRFRRGRADPWALFRGRTAGALLRAHWPDVAAVAFFVAYLLSTLVAVDRRAAVQEDLKVLLYLLVYLVVRLAGLGYGRPSEAAAERVALAVTVTLVATGGAVAITGVGVAAGSWQYNGAWDGTRLYSVFQYPNTLAAYLAAGLLAALGLWARGLGGEDGGQGDEGEKAGKAARLSPLRLLGLEGLAVAGYAALFAFVFTYSRGAYLVLPLTALVGLPFLPRGRRLATVLEAAVLLLALLPGGFGLVGASFPQKAGALYQAAQAGRLAAAQAGAGSFAVWATFLAGLPVVLVGSWLVALWGGTAARRALAAARRSLLPGAGVAGAVALGLRAPAGLLGLLPAALAQRLAHIGLSDYSAWSRLDWAKDALRLGLRDPILGSGGGAWNALYHQVQAYPYWSTQVHDAFAQVWVEAGALGLLVFLALWAGLLRGMARAARSAGDALPGRRALAAAAGTAALLLGLHSAIDFNLSLSAVSVALWALLAAVQNLSDRAPAWAALAAGEGRAEAAAAAAAEAGGRQARRREEASTPWSTRALAFSALGLLFLLTLSLAVAFQDGQAAAQALNGQRYQQAADLFRKAESLDPWTGSFRFDRGQALAALAATQPGGPGSPGGQQLLAQAQAEMERGIALSPTNANMASIYGAFLLQHGQIQPGLAQLERAIALEPKVSGGYDNLASARWQLAAQEALQAANPASAPAAPADPAALRLQARRQLQALQQLWSRYQAERRTAPPQAVREGVVMPGETPMWDLRLGQLALVQGRAAQAAQRIARALPGLPAQLQPEAAAWWNLTGQPRSSLSAEAAGVLKQQEAAAGFAQQKAAAERALQALRAAGG
ncbi:MAG: O-antigen ligase family protein [Bacillota bacterium]|nr:O-antigen ligase family protein [Bacillota bacterium]